MSAKILNNALRTALLASLATFMASPAIAEPGNHERHNGKQRAFREDMRAHIEERIARFDTDSDGQISRDEFLAGDSARDRFSEVDENADGMLSLEEMKQQAIAKVVARVEKKFAKLDHNNDNQVSRDEMHEHKFAEMDRNGDGYLNKRELAGKMRHGRGHGDEDRSED